MNSSGRIYGVLCGVAVAVAAVGCTSHQPSTAASSSAASATVVPSSMAIGAAGCTASDVKLTTLDAKAADEPTLALPAPPGWEYSASMNSPMIRGLVANKGLRSNGFTPNAVVTLEDLTGKVGNAQQGIDAEIAGAEQSGITIAGRTPGTVCGHPSTTITYTLHSHSATALIVAAADGQKMWAATLTLQTAEPDNPVYVADKQTILNNFQFVLPSQSTPH